LEEPDPGPPAVAAAAAAVFVSPFGGLLKPSGVCGVEGDFGCGCVAFPVAVVVLGTVDGGNSITKRYGIGM
jgi:hypothetical protein